MAKLSDIVKELEEENKSLKLEIEKLKDLLIFHIEELVIFKNHVNHPFGLIVN